MATVCAYWRPTSMREALTLLERPHTAVMGGGTTINATRTTEAIAVVDLQGLGLNGIGRVAPDRLAIGATATLQQIADHDDIPETIREAARREMPSTLRAQATLGGVLMSGGWESELLAALLVYEAVVRVARPGSTDELDIPRLLAAPALTTGGIITGVVISTRGVSATARAGRTRADRPIVAAVARRTPDGRRQVALSGVARTPVLVDSPEALDPPGDFRGSSEYRRALAHTLTARALEATA